MTAPDRRRAGAYARWLLRIAAGLMLGAVTAWVELAYAVVAALLMAAGGAFRPPRRWFERAVDQGLGLLVEVERWRVVSLLGSTDFPGYRFRGRAERESVRERAIGYLAVRSMLGFLGGLVLMLIGWGAGACVVVLTDWILTGTSDEVGDAEPVTVVYLLAFGALMLFLALAGLAGVVVGERRLALMLVAPTAEMMRRRIAELSATRAAIVAAVNDEKRRIERDLHDGVQQRLVALGVVLGRADRTTDPARASELIAQARAEARAALTDLKEVAWWIYPTALDNGGLRDALEAVAERAPMPVRVDYRAPTGTGAAWETVAYFVVSEAITNATKHATARNIAVVVETAALESGQGDVVLVRITDDGVGGADADGTGLSGLARRVTAIDGLFTVDSPAGGPTVVSARLPCG
jgi:signal transduction histidine kinase